MSDKTEFAKLVDWLSTFHGFECHVDQIDIPSAGKGLNAKSSKKAGEALLVIPPSALLNPLTLLSHPGNKIPTHLIPQPPTSHRTKRPRLRVSSPLNTTQILTLHLALHKSQPSGKWESPWKVYLDTVPQDLSWHPISWLCKDDKRLQGVPIAAERALQKVKRRFDDDLGVLKRVIDEEEPFKSEKVKINLDDWIWAWLIVNTRSVSLPLGFPGPTELYNHSLVPILDLANHSSSPSIPRPRQIPHTVSSHPRTVHTSSVKSGIHARGAMANHLIPGKIAYSFIAPAEGIKQGEELRFEYHGLSNTDLWVEYGFAESPIGASSEETSSANVAGLPSPPLTPTSTSSNNSKPDNAWNTSKYSGINVSHLLEAMFKPTNRQEEVLIKIGCWDHPSLHPYPEYEASHPLLMRLRVMHLSGADIAQGKLEAIEGFKIDYVSVENEAKVTSTLRGICRDLIREVEKYRQWRKEAPRAGMDMVDVLWWEQDDVAKGCLAVLTK